MEIIFDRQGVITYPVFPEVVTELIIAGHDLGMWSLEPRAQIESDLAQLKLHSYFKFIIGKDDVFGLDERRYDVNVPGIKQAVEAPESEGAELLGEIRQRMGLNGPNGLYSLPQTTQRWRDWTDQTDEYQQKHYKNPALFNLDGAVVIDSDHGHSLFGRPQDSGNRYYLEFFQRIGRNLILIPEHPDVWKSGQCAVRPETVMTELAALLLVPPAQPFQIDLGQQLGVYPA